jgi:hypothetical protein
MSEFVIVIEADNKRAFAAYSKGLDDLDRVMPQLMLVADERDKAATERYEKAKAEYEAKLLAFRKCRGVFALHEWPIEPWRPALARDYLESVRRNLVHMRDVAAASMGPYRMTEWQVDAMVGWEDGSEVERLKERYLQEESQ